MKVQLNAAARLVEAAQSLTNVKSEVTRILNGADMQVLKRTGDTLLVSNGNEQDVVSALKGSGWKFNPRTPELTHTKLDYLIVVSEEDGKAELEFSLD